MNATRIGGAWESAWDGLRTTSGLSPFVVLRIYLLDQCYGFMLRPQFSRFTTLNHRNRGQPGPSSFPSSSMAQANILFDFTLHGCSVRDALVHFHLGLLARTAIDNPFQISTEKNWETFAAPVQNMARTFYHLTSHSYRGYIIPKYSGNMLCRSQPV